MVSEDLLQLLLLDLTSQQTVDKPAGSLTINDEKVIKQLGKMIRIDIKPSSSITKRMFVPETLVIEHVGLKYTDLGTQLNNI